MLKSRNSAADAMVVIGKRIKSIGGCRRGAPCNILTSFVSKGKTKGHTMNRPRTLSVVFALILAAQHLLSQTNPYPFAVQQTGHGEKSIIFIPGLGCSGDVWKETRTLSLSFSAW